MNLENAIDIALQGDAIMFAGAGFSVGAINKTGNSVLKGDELSNYFCQKCGIKGNYSLPDSAEVYLDRFGEPTLVNELKTQFTAIKVSEHHKILCNIPWRRIYTTNYDNIIEICTFNTKPSMQSLTLKSPVTSIYENKPSCLHINGSVLTLTDSTIPEDFKLTDSSYANSSTFIASPWSEIFKNDLKVADSVFFIGYSLFDLHIKHVLFLSSILKEKVFFVTLKTPDEVLQVKLKQYGNIVPVGVEMFAEMVEKRRASFTPSSRNWNPVCFEKAQKPTLSGKKFRDDDLFNLLALGQSVPEFIFQEVTKSSQHKYYIHRTALERVVNNFSSSTPSDTIIHSDLGNGKSLFIDGLQYLLLDKGISVFSLIDSSDLFNRDFDMILKIPGRRVIIIDKYVHWFPAIKHMTTLRNQDMFFIFIERSAVHDVNFNHLAEYINIDKSQEIDLNILTEHEITEIVELMNLYGFWGKDAGLPNDRKKSLLRDTHRAQLQSILLNIIQSENIAQRLSQIVTIINENKSYTEVVLSVLILDSLGIPTTIDVIMNLLETDLFNSSSFRKNPQIRELIDIDTFQIHAKSSITAKYLLNRIENPSVLIQTLIKLSRNSSVLSHNRGIYYSIFRELMNYSNIQGILPSSGKLDNCIKFYESIKDLPHSRNNPHFWLQYAIARMATEDYEKAGKYFETSYAYARKKEYSDTYQIDNHFARFLLEKQMHEGKQNTAMESFRNAHRIIRQQSYDGKENRYYPYRVARLYFDFYHTYKSVLSTTEQNEFFQACIELKKNIPTLAAKTQNHYVIKDFVKKVDSILPTDKLD